MPLNKHTVLMMPNTRPARYVPCIKSIVDAEALASVCATNPPNKSVIAKAMKNNPVQTNNFDNLHLHIIFSFSI
jgi:hypothetical protein